MPTRRNLLRALTAGGLTAPLAGLAQRPARLWQIGFLGADSQTTGLFESFRQGLRQGFERQGRVKPSPGH